MPESEDEIIYFIRSRCCDGCEVTMEKVGGFIAGSRGVGSSMFNFGMNFGGIKFAVKAFNMPLILVTPQCWQKSLQIGKKKDFNYQTVLKRGKNKGKPVVKNRWKDRLVEHAQHLFPEVENITLKTADALLILHYTRNS